MANSNTKHSKMDETTSEVLYWEYRNTQSLTGDMQVSRWYIKYMHLHTFQALVTIAARVVSAKSSVVPRDGKQGERQDDH